MSAAIVIVNYRVYDDLARVLASIAPGLRGDDEVVVFDQESQASRLDPVRRAHPRVRFVAHAENVGFAAGVNRAARLTSAPYLLWLNPDAIVAGSLVADLEAWMAAHPGVAVAGPRVIGPDGAVQPSARRFPDVTTAFGGRSTWLTRHFPQNPLTRRNLPARDATSPVEVDWLAGSCLMTRRSVFDAVGGLDETFFLYWEDADFCRRVTRARLGSVVYVPSLEVRHAGGRSAAHTRQSAIRAFHESAHHLYRKHAGPWQTWAAPLVGTVLSMRAAVLARRRERD